VNISWHERLIQNPRLYELAQWPVIPLDSVPKSHQAVFLRNKHIVAQTLTGKPLVEIAAEHGLSAGSISHILDRCLGGDDGKSPALTRALVPNTVLKERCRKQNLPCLAQSIGNACSFKGLLAKLPALKMFLDDKIKAEGDERPEAEKLTPKSFLGAIKQYLAEHHWPQDRYPYTSVSQGYAAARRYLIQCRSEMMQAKQAGRKSSLTRPFKLRSTIRRAMRAIQFDEHKLDLRVRINLILNDELIPLPISRVSVLTAIDVDTECLLGGIQVPTQAPNQQDLLALLDVCVSPWQPSILQTPGLSYAPGACFPSGLPGGYPISFGFVHMDNAWIHGAGSVVEQFCQFSGATLNLGLPGQPKARRLKESVYDFLNTEFSHRMASTTGSYPTDPKKEAPASRKKTPVITYQSTDEIISVLLTDWNMIKRPSLGGAKPLEVFQYHLVNHFIRYIPQTLQRDWRPFVGSIVVPLHWYRHEKRHPHINAFYSRYRGPGLIRVVTKDTHIRIEFDRRDMRTVHAYRLIGEDLGVLFAPLTWQRFPHSLATRTWIHRSAKAYRLDMRDPLSAYFRLLLDNRDKPSYALSLLRVYTEFTADHPDSLVLSDEPAHPPTPSSGEALTQFIWGPNSANHRSES